MSVADKNITHRIVALPIADPSLGSVPLALRGGRAGVHLHLFQARSDIQVVIQVEEVKCVGFVLEGQVMLFGGGGRSVDGASASIYMEGDLVNQTRADEIGEFDFQELAAGRYDLTIEIEQTCVVVPELKL